MSWIFLMNLFSVFITSSQPMAMMARAAPIQMRASLATAMKLSFICG